MEAMHRFGMGWLPDIPDIRDYTLEHKEIQSLFKTPKAEEPPESIDLSAYCSPIENQGKIGSCTAHSVVGLVEWLEKRVHNEWLDASRRFLYKVTRKLYGLSGDTGAYIRGTIKALRIFGVCPEEFWPYSIEKFDEEPPAFCYSFAKEYQAIQYFRLDPSGKDSKQILEYVKSTLAAGLPFAFGFTVYSSILEEDVTKTGYIPFPKPGDRVIGGHAIMGVGYDDKKKLLKIRNSWGMEWGAQGYGWLPYGYVLKGLTRDFWVLVSQEYVSLIGL
jgi:C1A family cysteine protease